MWNGELFFNYYIYLGGHKEKKGLLWMCISLSPLHSVIGSSRWWWKDPLDCRGAVVKTTLVRRRVGEWMVDYSRVSLLWGCECQRQWLRNLRHDWRVARDWLCRLWSRHWIRLHSDTQLQRIRMWTKLSRVPTVTLLWHFESEISILSFLIIRMPSNNNNK